MKKSLFLYLFIFCVQIVCAETEYTLREYFQDNILKLDPIEGIYNVEMGFIQSSPYYSSPQKDIANGNIAIVKRSDSNYHIIALNTMWDNYPQIYISKINDGIYSFNFNINFSFNQRFVLESEKAFNITYTLSESQKSKAFERAPGSAVRVNFVYKAIKSFPTSSMYLEADTFDWIM